MEKKGRQSWSLQGLEVGYGRKSVLKDLSFSLDVGRFLSLLGPNGAGKTTLLRTMARLIPPMAGTISIAGHDFGNIAQAELARLQAVVLTDRLNPRLAHLLRGGRPGPSSPHRLFRQARRG
jgi:iron complex transport system ATP-binding protein